MTLLSTLGIGVLCAAAALVLKECKSPIAPLLTLLGGILLLLCLVPRISPLLAWAKKLEGALPHAVGETVSKVLATGFLCGVGSDVCTELGAPSLGGKLELLGRIEILLLSLPLLSELFSRVEALLS